MKDIVAADIGGTHARFAIATLDGKSVAGLGEAVTLRTKEHASFEPAWEEFQRRSGRARPQELAMAVAPPMTACSLDKKTPLAREGRGKCHRFRGCDQGSCNGAV
jgi:glucokinase